MGIASFFACTALIAASTSRVPPVGVLKLPDGEMQPQVVRDAGGTVHLLYYKGEVANGDLYYTRSKDEGSSWSVPVRVNSVAGDAIAVGGIRGGQIAVAKNGRPVVVWLGSKRLTADTADTGMSLFFSRARDDGSGFEPERNLQGATRDMDGGASVAADDAGDVFVAWHAAAVKGAQEKDRKVWLAKSTDEGKTFAAERVVWDRLVGACSCCSLKALADGNKLWILYRAAEGNLKRDPYLLASTDRGDTFVGTRISDWEAQMCPMSTFALDNFHGKLYAAWERRGVIQWQAASGAPSRGVGENAKYPVILTNGDGETLVLWEEQSGMGKVGTAVWQVYDRDGKAVPSQRGRREGVPAWSLVSAFARKDGSFVVVM
jgi:hypothetical protein